MMRILSRTIGRRALASRFVPITTSLPPARSFRPEEISISLEKVHVVDKHAAPPKASFSPDKPSMAQQSPKLNQSHHPPRRQSKPMQEAVVPGLPTDGWVTIRNIPPMSTLTDLLQSVNEVMDNLSEEGIADLDAVWKGGGQVSMLERDSSTDLDWVRSAHLMVSDHGRPNGWRVEFQNRSMAHAFLEHSRANKFHCAWKPATVEMGKGKGGIDDLAKEVSDCVIRLENADSSVTVDHVRHLFRRYDLTKERPSVRLLHDSPRGTIFLVHFADPSWARAAIRELQGIRVRERILRLAQYPKQLALVDS